MYPRLKSSLYLIPLNSEEFYIGGEGEGIYIPTDPYLAIARALTGESKAQEIATASATPVGIVQHFIAELTAHNYVELLSEPANQIFLDESLHLFNQRINPELSVITWRSGNLDGGYGEILHRQTFSIVIFGQTRLARTLLATLQAMGFSKSKIFEPPLRSRTKVNGIDVCGVVTRAEDIGLKHSELQRKIARLSALSPTAGELSQQPQLPDLLISTTSASADYIQEWMSEGIAHLNISQPKGRFLEIGPLVRSGEASCARCIQLHKRDQVPPFITLATHAAMANNVQIELPVASLAFVAGAVATMVSEFARTLHSNLIGHTYFIDLLNPLDSLTGVRHIFWNKHPECGCDATWTSDSSLCSDNATIFE
jgi:hypothetical protein